MVDAAVKCEFCRNRLARFEYVIVYRYSAITASDRVICHEDCVAALCSVYRLIGLRYGVTRYQRVTMCDGSVIDGYR